MRTKPYSELRNKMSPERRAKNATRVQIALIYLTLIELIFLKLLIPNGYKNNVK